MFKLEVDSDIKLFFDDCLQKSLDIFHSKLFHLTEHLNQGFGVRGVNQDFGAVNFYEKLEINFSCTEVYVQLKIIGFEALNSQEIFQSSVLHLSCQLILLPDIAQRSI